MKTAVFAFGRMNPPTIGHKKLVDKVSSIPGDHFVFLSHASGNKTQKPGTKQYENKDPLPFSDKLAFVDVSFPAVTVGHESVKTVMDAMKKLQADGYTDVVMVAGSDRVDDFTELLNKYQGQEYDFNTIEVVSAGERDPDAEGADGMSASKMRAAVRAGDFESFKQGAASPQIAKPMFDMLTKILKQNPMPGDAFNEEVLEMVTKKQIDDLEDQNHHSEVATLLAKHFGTEKEQKLVAKINALHSKRGHIERDEQITRDKVIKKYYSKVTEMESVSEAKLNIKKIHKAVDDGKSMDVIVGMFADKGTTNTDEIRKVVKDYKFKSRIKEGLSKQDSLMGVKDPVISISDKNGKPVDRLKMSDAAKKYKFNMNTIRPQFQHQDKVQHGQFTLSAPMNGQPMEAEAKKNCGCGQTPCVTYGDQEGIKEDDYRDGHDLELLKQVSAQIAQDVSNNDYTAIDDLLKNVSEAEMRGFLSEMESIEEAIPTDESINELIISKPAKKREDDDEYEIDPKFPNLKTKKRPSHFDKRKALARMVPKMQNILSNVGEMDLTKEQLHGVLSKASKLMIEIAIAQKQEVVENLYSLNKDDVMKSEILVKGVGRYSVEGLMKNISEKLQDLSNESNSMEPFNYKNCLLYTSPSPRD